MGSASYRVSRLSIKEDKVKLTLANFILLVGWKRPLIATKRDITMVNHILVLTGRNIIDA